MNQSFQETGFYPADILLPNVRDMRKWAVIACDQFTSQPAYWQKVEQEVGEAPTALRLVLPEVYLDRPDVEQRIQAVNACMETYLAENRFRAGFSCICGANAVRWTYPARYCGAY